MQHSFGNSHITFKHSNSSLWKTFPCFLIKQEIEGEIAEFGTIKAANGSCLIDIRWQCGKRLSFGTKDYNHFLAKLG